MVQMLRLQLERQDTNHTWKENSDNNNIANKIVNSINQRGTKALIGLARRILRLEKI